VLVVDARLASPDYVQEGDYHLYATFLAELHDCGLAEGDLEFPRSARRYRWHRHAHRFICEARCVSWA
jgi:hypothetical protein